MARMTGQGVGRGSIASASIESVHHGGTVVMSMTVVAMSIPIACPDDR
jgi:hypothetical protein